MVRLRERALIISALVAIGCGKGAPSAIGSAPNASASIGASARLEGGMVARVGDVSLARDDVASAARARKLDARDTARALVDEALLARAAVLRGALDEPSGKQPIIAALARSVVAQYERDARAQGPITEAELDAVMGEAWVDLDRPETRVVVHALIREGTPDAEAHAQALYEQLVKTSDWKSFLDIAKKSTLVPKEQLVAEPIDYPFTLEGRLAVPEASTTLDKAFSEAAFAIPSPGATSKPVHTGFGWHVIRLVDVRPPFKASFDAKKERLEGDVVRARIGDRFEKKLAELRASVTIQILASDADVMAPQFGDVIPQPPPPQPKPTANSSP